MFRRLRYRKWLVAGLGIAALAVPTTALAGSNLGATPLDGRNPDTVDAAQVAHPQLDPAIVKYLERYGYSASQIAAMSGGAFQVRTALQRLDPAIVKYLERYGYTPSQIAAMSGGAYKVSPTQLDPAIVKYLERYGYTPSRIAAMSGGAFKVSQPPTVTVTDGRSPDTIDAAALAHSPVVTVTRTPGFQWDDFGIGLSAALLALVALGLTRLFTSRGGHKPVTSN